MFINPYETLACRSYDIKSIAKAIKEANVAEELMSPITPKGVMVESILAISPDNNDIPSFSHPFQVELGDTSKFVIDTRPFTKPTRDGSIQISNPTDYEFLLKRGLLTDIWATDPAVLLSLGNFPLTIFTRWLSGNITSRLGLSADDQVKLTAVTLFYYYSLFRDTEFSDTDKINISKKLSQVSYIPITNSMELLEDINYMSGVGDYIDTVKTVLATPRIENLNVGLLFSMLSNSWFGLNAKEVIAVAVEHPPTFIAIMTTALESRSYKKSYLGNLVYDNSKRGIDKEFTKAVYTLINS